MNFYHVYAIIHSMNNFERSSSDNQSVKPQRVSKDVKISAEHQNKLNTDIIQLADKLSSELITPDQKRVIYSNVACEQTNTIYNLDISQAKGTTSGIELELSGGANADPAKYSFNSEYGLVTKKTTERGAQPVVIDELVARLAADYPDNDTLQELANSPIEDSEIDFTMYLITESLIRYAEERGAEPTSQAKYSITTVEDGPTMLPIDVNSEIIITKTPAGSHYQLDINTPAIDGYAVRSAVNYKLSAPLRGTASAKCTSLMYGTDEHGRVHGHDLLSVTESQANSDLGYATRALAQLEV